MPADDAPDPPLTCCEFFAGMGLMGLAVERVGGRVVWASDFDPVKNKLHRALLALRGRDGAFPLDSRDIHELTPAHVPAAALWSASFPCTDLSLAGKGRGIHAGQSAAVWQLLELLRQS
ncbi:MAG: DNA cytosine methyltransferase, partial [Planctomycetota bacterium]